MRWRKIIPKLFKADSTADPNLEGSTPEIAEQGHDPSEAGAADSRPPGPKGSNARATPKPRPKRGAKQRQEPDAKATAPEADLGVGVRFRDTSGAQKAPRKSEAPPSQAPKTGGRRRRASRDSSSAQPAEKVREKAAPPRAETRAPSRRHASKAKTQQPSQRPPRRPAFLFAEDLTKVDVPADAPRIVLLSGKPQLVVNHRLVPPLMFFGNPQTEAKADTTFDEVRKAAGAGVHLHCLHVEFTVSEEGAQTALDISAYLLQRALEADPDALVMFRVVFSGPPQWEKKYPDGFFRYVDGTPAEPSVCDHAFWSEAERLLGGFVRGLRTLENAERILGLHLDRGEWFFADDWGYDSSVAAERAFREWAEVRYGGDVVALQSAWFDGRASFDRLRVPDFNEYPLSREGFLRANRKERRWVDYHLFLSDAMVSRIQRLAWKVKEASKGYLLVAVSYGYTFEWSHPASGHLSLGKLLRTREIDIICGPPSYRDREMGGAAAFPGPVDSFALNGKLFISEEDFKTAISTAREPDDFNPVMETPQALEAAHWRGLGSALAHGHGLSWMDLWGNGWLNTPAIWKRAEKVRDALIRASATTSTDPDVAVLIDERSLAYLSDRKAFKQLVQDSREAVLRAGVSAGFYLLSDLAHRSRFPDAKLYVFLNAWDVRPEVREAIKSRLQRGGKTLFWVYAAGLFENGRSAIERVREVTGIAIRPQPFNSRAGTTILSRKHPLTELLEERALSVVDQLEPSYFAIPEENAVVLGEYTQTGLPSFVVREVRGETLEHAWRTAFLGEPLINEKIIRGLCQLAGVQVWNYHGDVVHARPPFLSIHYRGAGHRTATLPDRWHAYDVIEGDMVAQDTTHLKSQATDGATQVFLVGEQEDVKELASLDTNQILERELNLPPAVEEDDAAKGLDLSVEAAPQEVDEFLALMSIVMDATADSEELDEVAQPKPTRRRTRPEPQQKAQKKPSRRERPKGRKKGPEPSQDSAKGEAEVGVVFRNKE